MQNWKKILTIVSMSKKLIMRPNTVKVFHGRINNYFSLEECDIVKDSSIDRNCNTKEPGHHLKYASKTNIRIKDKCGWIDLSQGDIIWAKVKI